MNNSGSVRELLTAQKSRLEALKQRHSHLSSRIEQAYKSPSTTDFYLRQLKKEKLMLKEQIEGIRASEAASA
ncbi:MAG: YdcH family protein [Alphaproteobacteria bacterium]|nr:YdcH family protein [Alphaproteobacteria bacterium]